jgi:arylsulfatase A-like enzyme
VSTGKHFSPMARTCHLTRRAPRRYGASWHASSPAVSVRPVVKSAPRDILATVLNIDLAPTMLAFADVPIPSTMQGRDLSPLWTQAPLREPWRKDFLYEHYLSGLHNPSASDEKLIPSSEGVRNERYTYLRYPRQTGESEQLFDRVGDANELKNIIHSLPTELIEQLRNRTDELIEQNG